MARQLPPYVWDEIKADFEAGMSQAELRKKYNISAGTLGSKIKRAGWVLSHEQKAALTEFQEASAKVCESFRNANETQKKEMIEQVNITLENNAIISNNRKIAKAFQSLIVRGISDKRYATPTEIKQGTSALKDLEAIANPQSSKIEITNTNAQQNQITEIKRTIVKLDK
nr:MAG TPA: SatD family (SatD) [Caudoviricetes sp.]